MTAQDKTSHVLNSSIKEAFLAVVGFVEEEKLMVSVELQGYGLILCGILTLALILEEKNAAKKY